MIDGRLPIRVGQRQALRIRYGDKLHIAILAKYGDEFWQVQPTMQRRQDRPWTAAAHGKAQKIEMRVNNIKLIGVRPKGLLLHENHRRIAIRHTFVQPKRLWTRRLQTGSRMRIATGVEGHVVPLTNEFFGEIRYDSLGASIEL